MSLNINSIVNQSINTFRDQAIPSLQLNLQKKVAALALFVFGCLGICLYLYLSSREKPVPPNPALVEKPIRKRKRVIPIHNKVPIREKIVLSPNKSPNKSPDESSNEVRSDNTLKPLIKTSVVDLNEKIPNTAIGCNQLANTLPSGGKIKLLDDTEMSQQELYLKTIQLDPKCAPAYNGLTNTLPSGGKIMLPDDTEMSQQELYLKTIQLDPKCALAYFNLASTLPFRGQDNVT